jgi:rhodanese-related sulfurtransferase
MSPTVLLLIIAAAGVVLLLWLRHRRSMRELAEHSVSPRELHKLLSSDRGALVYDVRLPLDLLAHSEIIPGAKRVAPHEILDNPSVLPPKDKTFVVYCTCPGDKTSRTVLDRALGLGFTNVRFLKGGISAWKAQGYPVERYDKSFHLDIRQS